MSNVNHVHWIIQRSRADGTLRVPREHGARGKVLNWGTLFFVPWKKKFPIVKPYLTLEWLTSKVKWHYLANLGVVCKRKLTLRQKNSVPQFKTFPLAPCLGAISTASLDHPMYVVNIGHLSFYQSALPIRPGLPFPLLGKSVKCNVCLNVSLSSLSHYFSGKLNSVVLNWVLRGQVILINHS